MLGLGDKLCLGLTTVLLLAASIIIVLQSQPDTSCCEWTPPRVTLQEELSRENEYSVMVLKIYPPYPIDKVEVSLFDPEGGLVESHFIGLHPNETGVWQGIDITWDGQTANQSIAVPDFPYSDLNASQARISEVLNGSDANGPIHLSYLDGDRNNKVSPGDRFFLDSFDPEAFTAFRDYTLKLRSYPSGEGEAKTGATLKLAIYPPIELKATKLDQANFSLSLTINDACNWCYPDLHYLLDTHLGVALLTPEKKLVRSHLFGLREAENGQWVGIAVYYNESQLSHMADPEAARARIDEVLNGSDAQGPIYLRYGNGLQLHSSPDGDIEDFSGYWVQLIWLPTGEPVTQLQLKG